MGATWIAGCITVNNWIKNFWRTNTGGEYIDAFSAVVDPTSTTLAAATNYYNDGVHPSGLGAYAIASSIYPAFSKWGTFQWLPSSAADDITVNAGAANRYKNPMMLGSAGSITAPASGTSPDGWSVTSPVALSSAVCSVVSRADGLGNDLQVVCTASAAGQTLQVKGSTNAIGNITAGSSYYVVAEVSVSSNTGLGLITFNANTDAFTSGLTFLSNGATVKTLPSAIGPLVMRSLPAVAINGTYLQLNFLFTSSAAGSFTVKMGRVALYKMPDTI